MLIPEFVLCIIILISHQIYSTKFYSIVGTVCQPTQFARFVGHDASGFDVSLTLIYSRSFEDSRLTQVLYICLPKIPNAAFSTVSSEGACYAKCAAVNINPKTAGNVTIIEFNMSNQSCMCKTTAELAYTNFVVSTSWTANLIGNCARYPKSKMNYICLNLSNWCWQICLLFSHKFLSGCHCHFSRLYCSRWCHFVLLIIWYTLAVF